MHQHSLKEVSALLDSKEVSSTEVTRALLTRIESHEPTLNAMITVDNDGALEAAKHADETIKQLGGTASAGKPLLGVPIIHKDIFCTEGVLTTCASHMLHNFVSPYDATVVKRLRAEGTVMLGKANMDEFAMGSSNENSHYGAVGNPWQTDRVPGGSSGGSAAAVAAGYAPVATGTDTGGSIRQPAAFCGLSGIKPTYGRVSRYGMIAFASSLDQGGVLARSAEDCAYMLGPMSGVDPRDSTSVDQPVDDFVAALDGGGGQSIVDTGTTGDSPLKGARIGVAKEYFSDGLDDEIASSVREAIAKLETLGATIVEISLPLSLIHISEPTRPY